jgi:hypothetical protein
MKMLMARLPAWRIDTTKVTFSQIPSNLPRKQISPFPISIHTLTKRVPLPHNLHLPGRDFFFQGEFLADTFL